MRSCKSSSLFQISPTSQSETVLSDVFLSFAVSKTLSSFRTSRPSPLLIVCRLFPCHPHALVFVVNPFFTTACRVIGCLKLQIIYRKRATNYGALLRKMTYRDKASYDSTPPCTILLSVYLSFKFHLQRFQQPQMYVHACVPVCECVFICCACVRVCVFVCVGGLCVYTCACLRV